MPVRTSGATLAVIKEAPVNVRLPEYGALGNDSVDEAPAIQAALDHVRPTGGHVRVPDGVYRTNSNLLAYSNTTLELAPGATIKRNSLAVDGMIHNAAAPSPTASYVNPNAQKITITGGTWDANRTAFPGNVNGISFGYGSDLTIADTTIKNIHGWHHTEFHGSRRVTMRNVVMDGINDQTLAKEMIQLDVTNAATPAGWYNGVGDALPNIDFAIIGCRFINGARGLGSHTTVTNTRQSHIKLVGCHFENMGSQAIHAQDYQHMSVLNSTFKNCARGIKIWGQQLVQSFEIAGNSFETIGTGDTTAYAIQATNDGTANRRVGDLVVAGNSIRGCGGLGVDLNLCFQTVAADNTIRDCGLYGYRNVSSQISSLSGNVIRQNGASASPVGDVYIGKETGSADTSTSDVNVVGNMIAAMVVATGTRYLISNNNFLTSYATTATAGTSVQKFNNFVGGTWTP